MWFKRSVFDVGLEKTVRTGLIRTNLPICSYLQLQMTRRDSMFSAFCMCPSGSGCGQCFVDSPEKYPKKNWEVRARRD